MPRVAALYRYPVKGFRPKSAEHCGFRRRENCPRPVLGIRFADAEAPITPGVRKRGWWPL